MLGLASLFFHNEHPPRACSPRELGSSSIVSLADISFWLLLCDRALRHRQDKPVSVTRRNQCHARHMVLQQGCVDHKREYDSEPTKAHLVTPILEGQTIYL